MDVQELDECELIQTEIKVRLDTDETVFMQGQRPSSFNEMIQGLLGELEAMTKPKAARTVRFLQQLLRDQQRMAPHLRNPVLRERAENLQALMSVFADDDTQLRADEQDWCMQRWQRLLPLLEGSVTTGGEIMPPMPSTNLEEAIEVVDSQERHMENGSRKQVVRQSNGTQRNLTQEEEDTIAENEEAEAFAAELLREEDAKLQDVFTSVELREWEAWAARTSRIGPGAKRARVQVTVQGEGGRIVKQEDWLVGVNEGEYLAYSVSVRPYTDEDDTADPQAASSGTHGGADGLANIAEGEGGQVEAGSADLLPVTGEGTPAMWAAEDRSQDKDILVDDFMETPLADRFFQAWASGQVSDRLIGQRFGYGVLGRFYGKRDWQSGIFDEIASEEPVVDEGEGEHATESHAGGLDTGGAGLDVHSEVEMPVLSAGELPAAEDGPIPSGGVGSSSALPSASTERVAGSETASSGSKQTSLAHWLL